MTTPNFVVISETKKQEARRIAIQFETIRAIVDRVMPVDKTLPPLRIFVTRNAEGLQALMPNQWPEDRTPAGVFRTYGDRAEVVIRADQVHPDEFRVVYHEYYHFLQSKLPVRLPLWLSEGMAEFWSSTHLNKKEVRIGRPIGPHVLTLRNSKRIMPLEELFEVNVWSPYYNERAKTGIFYATSWALTHYLFAGGGPERLQQVGDYIDRVGRGETAEEAAVVFGELPVLRKELEGYIRKFQFPGFTMPSPIDPDSFQARGKALSPSESLGLRGDFLSRGNAPAKAREMLMRAMKADSSWALPVESLAQLEHRLGRFDTAQSLYAKAVTLSRVSAETLYRYATTATEIEPEAKEQFLSKAIREDERMVDAYAALARHYAGMDGGLARSSAVAGLAVDANPRNADALLLKARVLAAGGRREEAVPPLRTAVAAARSSHDVEKAKSVCWFGALHGLAAEVLSACEHAVALAPKDEGARDRRGLARALTGDSAGAVDDFRFTIEESSSGAVIRTRKQWVDALSAGENPFDAETRVGLLEGPF